MWSMEVFEKGNGLLKIEEYIIKELLKENEISIGNLIGNLMYNYEVTNVIKIKTALISLLEEKPFSILKLEEIKSLEDITYTREIVSLTDIGKLYYIEDDLIKIDYPICLLRERNYKFKDSEIYNVSLDRKKLYDYLKGNILLEDLTFSREFNRSYIDEKTVIKSLVEEGKGTLKLQKGYKYIDSLSKLEIEDSVHNIKLDLDDENKIESEKTKLGIFKEAEVIYLYKVKSENELSLELRSLEYILKYYKEKATDNYLNVYKDIILNDYVEKDYQIEEIRNLNYIVFDNLTKEIYLREEPKKAEELNLIVEHLDVDNKVYVIVDENSHEKLDMFNLETELNNLKNSGREIKGILGIYKKDYNDSEVYFVSNKGEIKVMKEKDVIGRNKSVRGTNLSNEISLINIMYKRQNEDKLLLITEQGFIKILNLKEYKAKNKESKYVMGIHLSENDEVIYSCLINKDSSEIVLSINNEERIYNVDYLISSKVNKGKKLKMTEKITEIKLLKEE